MSYPGKAVQHCWHLVDASSQTVGRIAAIVAPILKGKHKPTYRPNADCGDTVVIVNAEKVSYGKINQDIRISIFPNFEIGSIYGQKMEE